MRPLIVVLAALLFAAPASSHQASHAEVRFMRSCSQHHVFACIHRAALHRRQSYATMRFVANRETGGTFSPTLTNSSSGAAGLFQFLASTWYNPRWNPYRRHSPYSAKWASLAAALALQLGYHSWWSI